MPMVASKKLAFWSQLPIHICILARSLYKRLISSAEEFTVVVFDSLGHLSDSKIIDNGHFMMR